MCLLRILFTAAAPLPLAGEGEDPRLEGGEDPPEDGWAFWYPETIANPSKRARVVAERQAKERAAAEHGFALRPPHGYVHPSPEKLAAVGRGDKASDAVRPDGRSEHTEL